jgi:hypothetical protein
MSTPLYDIRGIDHLRWEYVAGGGDTRDVVLRFAGPKVRFTGAFSVTGFRMSDWHFTEGVYNWCDEVRVFDQNEDGAQLEFGRFLVQFVRHGEVLGQHFADSVAIRQAG